MSKATVKCMVLIVNRDQGNRIGSICHQHQLYFSYACMASGTASSEYLNYLGLGETEKELVFTFARAHVLASLQKAIAAAIHIEKPNSGIIFTMPLSSISSLFLKNIMLNHGEETVSMEEGKYALICAVVNKGCQELVMAEARKAGAKGGTLLHARSLDSEASQSFMGLTVQAEKDVILILSTADKKQAIMEAVNQTCGLKSEAGGCLFALPVDSVLGCNC